MRISGRLALERAPPDDRGTSASAGYHGMDVLVRMLSTHGFIADLATAIPAGAQVRLRLPGLGAANARVVSSEGGQLRAQFANPVGAGRLARVPGFARNASAATA